MKCTHCQATQNPEDIFCGNCGKKIQPAHNARSAPVRKRVPIPTHKNVPRAKPDTQNDTPVSYISAGFIGAGVFTIIVLILGLAEFLGFQGQQITNSFIFLCLAVLAGLVFAYVQKILSLQHIAAFLGGTAIAFIWIIVRSNTDYDYSTLDYIREFGSAFILIGFLYWILKKNVWDT
ncbi:MAG TPA: zinc ribbon domain-containing protein [Gammaproteobacteria bacterium]|nr:zinc ribbon domain-containing protein [Gammaproteobacteria bacterium]